MCRHRSTLIPVVLLLFSFTTLEGSPASAATRTWSGPASPCGSTLQGCINGASPGDIVEVATNVPINEDLTIDKSLTLKGAGANKVLAYITHPVLSGPAIDRILKSDLDELVVTDTIPLREAAKNCPKIRQLTVAGLLAETMRRIRDEESVSSLYID